MNTITIEPTEGLIQFLTDFNAGHIKPRCQPFEYASMPPDLESIVMRFAHGDCHAWSEAMQQFNSDLKILLLRSASDGIYHSFLTDQSERLCLDANGVHTKEDLLDFWQFISRDPKISVDELSFKIIDDQDEINDAKSNINYWYTMTSNMFELLKH